MRLFVAVYPGEQFSRELATQVDLWRRDLALKWVAPQAWHLTLQFLGNWPESRWSPLIEGLQDLSEQSPFTLTAGQLGGFPNLRRPRVLFLHLSGLGELEKLAGRVRATTAGVWPTGPQDKRPFRPHLTLARLKNPLGSFELQRLQNLLLPPLPTQSIAGISLVSSELRPKGAIYQELCFIPLRGE